MAGGAEPIEATEGAVEGGEVEVLVVVMEAEADAYAHVTSNVATAVHMDTWYFFYR